MTPEKLQAFLDDLARISAKHGVYVFNESDDGLAVARIVDDNFAKFAGYRAHHNGVFFSEDRSSIRSLDDLKTQGISLRVVRSLDVSKLSHHERLKLIGGQWFEEQREALQEEAEFMEKHGVPGSRLGSDDGGQG